MGNQVRQPLVTANIVNSNRSVSNTDQKVLFVGQMLSSGTATDGALEENIPSDNSEDTLFGAKSMLAQMIRAAKKINPIVRFDAIALDDASGTAAAHTIAFTGTATEAGTYTVAIGSATNHTFSVAVASGDTASEVGDTLAALIVLDTQVPVTGANSTGTVTLTASNQGTVGTAIGISVTGAVAGLTHAVAATVPGATDPTLTSVFDVIGDLRYQGIVWPYPDDTSEVRTLLDARFNVDGNVLDGAGFTSQADSLANNLTALNLLNTQTLTFFVDQQESETSYLGPAQLELDYVKSSMFASVRALRLTDAVSISQFVTSTAPADQFGGVALASLPYFNTPLSDLPAVSAARGFTQTEIGQLNDAGGSVLGVNRTGTTGLVGEVYTTYKTDAAGNPDVTFEFLNYVDTQSNIREYYVNNNLARFAQSRLTEGSVQRGRDTANADVIAVFQEKLYQDLAGPDFTLVEDGETAFKFYKDNLVVSLDLATGRATVQMVTKIVTQLREILMTIKIAFSFTEV
jgi:phage tail sheath gpL-like